MSLTPGSRIGSYEIVGGIGAGGMGEVYRARDTRLGRDVAIKTLPEAFAHDAERVARFEREARTLAALNHPNIAAIYGLEEVAPGSKDPGTRAGLALVMELVEGDDLSQRIAAHRIPVPEALPIARQIAAALEAAHEAGVVHRDLKPANIKVRDDGTAKVLDFGLAKAMAGEGSQASLSNSPTLTSQGTQIGVILGTAAYMAPEQAKGRAVDRRADVWAFGVVLYEMLTGRRLFEASDVSDTLAAVLTREPEWPALPASTPLQVRRLLARCLVKDRASRLDSMSVARMEIDDAIASPDTTPKPAAPRLNWPVAAALLVAGLGVGALLTRVLWTGAADESGSSPTTPIVTHITPAPDALSAFTYGFTLSPDGSTLVYTARQATGVRALWKRRLADTRAEPMPGTEDASYPFWSPDGLHVAFFAGRAIKSVPVAGGPARTITAAPYRFPRGSWNARNEIVFSTGIVRDGIQRVPAAGGRPAKLPIDGDISVQQWLPDDRHFLFVRYGDDNIARLFAGDADAKEAPVQVYEFDNPGGRDAEALYCRAGFLLFNRAGILSMQSLNVQTLQLEGPVVPLGDPAGTPRGWLAASAAGRSIVVLNPSTKATGGTPGDPVSKLLWVDRTGRPVGQVGPEARYWTMRLSPDGQRALANSDQYVWSIESETGLRTRVVEASSAIWMPDSRHAVFRRDKRLLSMPITGEGQPRLVFETAERPYTAWAIAPDEKSIVAASRNTSGSMELFVVTLKDGAWRLLVEGPYASHASFSPNGLWIAYASESTGRLEIYARTADGTRPAVRLSADGGAFPFWRKDGNELFFLSPTDEVVSVDVSSLERTGTVGARRVLFRMVVNDIVRELYPPYAVAPDGQKFLINVPAAPEPLTLIQLPRK